MNNIAFTIPCVFVILFSSMTINAQHIAPAGGGEYPYFTKDEPCLTDGEREFHRKQIEANKRSVDIENSVSQLKKSVLVQFIWPVVVDQESPFDYSLGITNFVDQDPSFSGSQYGATNLDYNCGNRSYDTTSGYNHQGIDIATWPFPWYLYEQDYVIAVAAADGVIVNKLDGNDDDHCSCTGNLNAVFVEHVDGSQSWYFHLKKNGITSKPIGATVSAGEFLGYVASSGCSTAPHLHFEVYDASGALIDPYAGSCNSLNTQSWWANQPAYLNSRVNAIKTHTTAPVMGCPSPNEVTNFSDCFQSGERIFFGFYYSDQPNGAVSNMRLILPNQNVWSSWNHTSPGYFSASWWYWWWDLPTNGPFGVWTVEVDFQGQTYAHQFHFEEAGYTGILPINGTQSTSRIVETDGYIQSLQTIASPAVVHYDAGQFIELSPLFEVQFGSIFYAYIDGCGN